MSGGDASALAVGGKTGTAATNALSAYYKFPSEDKDLDNKPVDSEETAYKKWVPPDDKKI